MPEGPRRSTAMPWRSSRSWSGIAGLGNGGLGRLASCFMDSVATLKIPAYGYGIRYDYGIFYQVLENGYQVERCDNWLRYGDPWEFERPEHMYEVRFYGRVREYVDENGRFCHSWEDTEKIMAMACDTLIPGYGNDHVINMRLWAAKSTREFNLELFNVGKYVSAVEDKVLSENISKVLYPSEEAMEGRELRLKQQYFFVSATFQDIMRRFTQTQGGVQPVPGHGGGPAQRHPSHHRHRGADADPAGRGASVLGRGLGDLREDLRLHQPHHPARGPGDLARGDDGEGPAPAHADHLRDQPPLPERRAEAVSGGRGPGAQDVPDPGGAQRGRFAWPIWGSWGVTP